jgi:60 kDa SS-A/Ro ribonucleoprotein
MVNKAIFQAMPGPLLPATDAVNRAGARTYALEPRAALAQYAVTGTFNDTFYAGGGEQLDAVLALAAQVEPAFLAKLAVYAAETAHMKDMPVALLAILSRLDSPAFARAFPRVVTSGKMLRGFVQVMRSGSTGRKSLGTRPKRMVQAWFDRASTAQFLHAMVGNDPSLADVIRMVHPRPATAAHRALYAWAIGRPYDVAALPPEVAAFEAFKRDASLPLPDVPFQMLTALPLTKEHWAQVAARGSWQMVRQSLNTFARKGAFEVEGTDWSVARTLADAETIRRARVMPYQLMVAWHMAGLGVPVLVTDALQEAMEIAIGSVPVVCGEVVVCPDVSGSMSSPVTGRRQGSSSVVRCIDVAGLVAAAMLRRNSSARVLPFAEDVVNVRLDGRDSVMANARILAGIGGGGTNCSAPLKRLADDKAKVSLVLFVSDNQSWMDARGDRQASAMMREWARVKRLNPAAKLVCLDIQPYAHTPATGADVLNVGGFSDGVFGLVAAFAAGRSGPDAALAAIEAVEL